MSRAKPRPAEGTPFSSHPRPKWWHDAQREAIKRRSNGDGMSTFNALLGWYYAVSPRTPEEELWFGKQRSVGDFMPEPHPFFALLPKEKTFNGTDDQG